MRAVVISEGRLSVEERPTPTILPTQVLVRVVSAGLNGADILQARGVYPPPAGIPADMPGLEFAGTVVECGDAVTTASIGDRVMAILGGAAQAEYVAVEANHLLAVPDHVALDVAGAFPETYLTAHDALFRQGGLKHGERLLVQGGAGGVGLAALQLGVAAGALVTSSIRDGSPHSGGILSLGGTAIGQSELAGSGPYDVVLELVGAPNLPQDLDVLASCGRIVVIGIGAGALAQLNLAMMMAKRARLSASTLRSRSTSEKAELVDEFARTSLRLLESGALTIPISASVAASDVQVAYDSFVEGGKFGKIILTF